MRKHVLLIAALGAMSLAPSSGYAALLNNTAYVEPTTGTDSGTCGAATAPCATLNQALANITTGGNIYVLSGGTFGPIYLTSAVSIHGPTDDSFNIVWSGAAPGCVGAPAGSCAATSNYAVDIEATASDVFKFRYIIINNGAGTNGAMKVGNALEVKMDDVVLRGGTGSPSQLLLAEPNTGTQFQLVIQNGNIGFSNTAGGVVVQPQGSSSAAVLVNHVIVQNLDFGLKFNANSTTATVGVAASVDDSQLLNFSGSGVAIVATGTALAQVAVTRSNLLNAGQQAVQVNGANALANIYSDTIFGNNIGVNVQSGGAAHTEGNSAMGNANNGANNCASAGTPTACSSVLTPQQLY
jgi:hypothetical protein